MNFFELEKNIGGYMIASVVIVYSIISRECDTESGRQLQSFLYLWIGAKTFRQIMQFWGS